MKNDRQSQFSSSWQIVLSCTILLIAAVLFSTTAYGQHRTRNKKSTVYKAYPKSLFNTLKYRNIGPFRGGRSIAVAGDAQHPSTFYFGSTGGGVWKTIDGGISWLNISDHYFKSGNVGALAVSTSNPNIIYAGMGESFIRGNMGTGDGLYKSEDAGKTWHHIGLSKTHVISKIVIDPTNPDLVYVAALGHVFGDNPERGIYRSKDGGKSWKKILFVDNKTGASDIAIDPNNDRILYAGMWEAFRKPWFLSSGGPGSGLYKSNDGGDHWKNISHRPGLPKGILGKIGVSVSGANADRVYAFIEAKNGGVFRSDDGGKTWTRHFHHSELTQRAWYYSRIYADPKNENVVYFPQVSGLFRSVDGGNTFKALRTPHGDNHVLWINPEEPKTMIVGNDGGATVSFDGGQSWSSENNQPTAQFYHVSVDNQFPYHIYGAQQDNSTVEIMSRTYDFGITDKDWWPAAGGESGFVIPDLGHPGITFGGGYDGALTRYNRNNGQRRSIDVWPDNPMGHGAKGLRDRFQWTYPVLLSIHQPHALYVASQYVYKSTNEGMNWTRISPDLTRDDSAKQVSSGGPITQDNTAVEYYNTIFSLAESPLKEGLLWAGSDDGLVHLTTDDGKTWLNVTPKSLPEWATISTIEASHFEAGTAFVAARKYRLDDFHPYLYKTSDYGKHWTQITNGLPDDEPVFVIRQDTKDPMLLFAGTMRGVYVSFNGGNFWQPLQLNLPHVPIHDMAIQSRENDLVLATHGRSFWIFDHLEILRQFTEKLPVQKAYLFQPKQTYLTKGYHFHRPGTTVGENPVNGLEVFYYLKDKVSDSTTISLQISTSKGDSITSFSNRLNSKGKAVHPSKKFYANKKNNPKDVLTGNQGLNSFVWNLRYPDATAVPGAVLWDGNMAGPKLIPGKYELSLKLDNATFNKNFVIEKDPRIQVSLPDLSAQFSLLMKIHNKLDETDRAINHIRSVKNQIQARMKPLKGLPIAVKLNKSSQALIKALNKIENALMQTKSHASEDPLNYPIKLNNKLAALAASIGSSYNRPNQQDYEVFKMLSAQVNLQLEKLKPLLNERINNFNQLFKSENIPAVYIKK